MGRTLAWLPGRVSLIVRSILIIYFFLQRKPLFLHQALTAEDLSLQWERRHLLHRVHYLLSDESLLYFVQVVVQKCFSESYLRQVPKALDWMELAAVDRHENELNVQVLSLLINHDAVVDWQVVDSQVNFPLRPPQPELFQERAELGHVD